MPADELALASEDREKQMVGSAVRTDLILSAEIMTIALADVSNAPLLTQAGVLIVVGLAMTVAVYGAVGLIVKMDDIGLHLAKARTSGGRALGRLMVRAMPVVMDWLTEIPALWCVWT